MRSFCNSLLVFFKEFDLLGSLRSGAISESLGSPKTSNSGLESAELVLTERRKLRRPRCLHWRGGVGCLLREQSEELDTLVRGVVLKKLKPLEGGGDSVATEKYEGLSETWKIIVDNLAATPRCCST